MEMLGQFHAYSDSTPVEKVSSFHGIGEWLEPRADMGVLGRRHLLSLPGIGTPIVWPVHGSVVISRIQEV
jgi:hypothetical protein